MDCYDYDRQVVWNVMSGELWRRTTDRIKDILATWGRARGVKLQLSFAKVAEMQARGVVHFHALIRLDGTDPANPTGLIAPHLAADFAMLETAIRRAVTSTRFRTPPHPDNLDGWLIEWGQQLDVRPVRLASDGAITETAVAGYIAKYATKATEATGHISGRITGETVQHYTETRTHTARLVAACWRLGRPGADLDPHQAAKNSGRLSYKRLRRWTHMLGFGGHFSTKSRRYSTTLRALREARASWRRDQHRTAEHITDTETTLIVGTFTYADTGWRTIGDALLANTAAAKAREHRLTARDEYDQVPDLDA
jgi:hypothetical protein